MARTKSKTAKLVRLSDKQIFNLQNLAQDKDYNLSEAIRYIIDKYFDEQPKTEKHTQLNLFNNHE